jgi:hypothetical protein
MNIFVLDLDVKKCAQYHCNKHIVKMITETAQILCSTYYYTKESDKSPYKLAHKNHPCTKWARESLSNWKWLRDLGLALYNEYQFRYGDKIHKAGEVIKLLEKPNLIDIGITARPQAMPDEYKNLDPVTAYRRYYINDKKDLLKYKNREIPEWLFKTI